MNLRKPLATRLSDGHNRSPRTTADEPRTVALDASQERLKPCGTGPVNAARTSRRQGGFAPKTDSGAQRRGEGRLVADAKSGDGEAFGELCLLHRPLILRIARRITGNLEDAQDAVQDSLLRAYLAIGSFDERATFRTWLTRITINSSLMLLRKRRGDPALSSSLDGSDSHLVEAAEPSDPAPNPETALLVRERRRAIRDAVARLPDILQNVIEAGHLADRSPVEIAGPLGISHGAAKARQFRAIAVLRKSRFLLEVIHAGRQAMGYQDAA